jgi:hypothetical protein
MMSPEKEKDHESEFDKMTLHFLPAAVAPHIHDTLSPPAAAPLLM